MQKETMSLTVVSALNKPSQASPADSAPGRPTQDDVTSDTQGFAGVLRAQFKQAASNAPVAQGGLPADNAPPAGTETSDYTEDTALFAALGLAIPDSNRISDAATSINKNTSLPGSVQTDSASAKSLANTLNDSSANPLAASATAAKHEPADFLPTNDLRAGKRETNLAAKPIVDDKSAIIAAASARKTPIAEITTGRHAAFEAIPANVSAPIGRDAPLSIATPVRDAAWTSDFADKLVWMATNDKQVAKLTLNPAHMGPLEISLNIDKGHATASFVSANADVREALENALPRLREMFASAGISLGQTNVSAESFQQQADANTGNGGKPQWSPDNAILVADSAASMPLSSITTQFGNGMVDTFA